MSGYVDIHALDSARGTIVGPTRFGDESIGGAAKNTKITPVGMAAVPHTIRSIVFDRDGR